MYRVFVCAVRAPCFASYLHAFYMQQRLDSGATPAIEFRDDSNAIALLLDDELEIAFLSKVTQDHAHARARAGTGL